MSHSSMRYESVPNPLGEPQEEAEEDPLAEDDYEANELEPLVSNELTRSLSPPPARGFLGGLFSGLHSSNDLLHVSPVTLAPATPISSDGVFTNIPAKPSSSRDRRKEDEELGEDEWIFMTPEQRKKLAPPKYSRIKRDRAPRYTTEYTPPPLPMGATPRKAKRGPVLRPRINSLPAGSIFLFISTILVSTTLPFLGFFLVYLSSQGRWTSHATRLGCRTGLGLSIFHMGAMICYIPALLPGVFAPSSIPLILFLLWTAFIALPFGWRLSGDAAREYMWVKAEERILVQRILRANLVVASSNGADDQEDEEDEGSDYRYIEGTDIRVRDLRKILARARDARLARSLRAAGF